MLAGHRIAVRDLRLAREPDRDAAPVISVVGFGDHREADALRGAHRLALALHQLLLRHRQTEGGEDLVGLFLVARQLDRDMGGAARDRRLDALLKFAVTELHQGLLVQAQPGDLTLLRGAHQRGGRGAERAALSEANELIARGLPAPVGRDRIGGTKLGGQERAEQLQAELAGRNALIALRVFVDDRVTAGLAGAARLAEGHFLAGHVLQLDRDVLEHVPEPGALILTHAPEESARLAVRAAVLGKAGQCGGERIDEPGAETAGGPGFECTEVELESNHGKSGVHRRTDVNGSIENAHGRFPPGPRARPYSLDVPPGPGLARRVCRLNVAPAIRMCNLRPSMHTGCPSVASAMDEWVMSAASTTVTPPLPSTSMVSSGPMKAAVSSSRPMPTAKGL